MKIHMLTAVLGIMCLMAGSVVKGDEGIANICYDTVDGSQFCTAEHVGNVQVFIYNAGWCPPCNSEMAELSQAYSEFEGKSVTFASLSGEGFSHGSQPDKTFLKQWQTKHHIPFVVAGKFRDFGTNFGANGYIPFSVIVDKSGKIAKSGNLDAAEILSTVRDLLKS